MRTGAALAVAVAMILVGGGSASAVRLSGPILTPPGSLAEPATTPCGSSLCGVVDYGFSVTGGTPPYTLSCNYPSGGLFPIGTYPVTCTATDATGATSAPASFMLTIGAPPTPPPSLTITPPANMSVQASLPCPTNTSLACGVITYTYGITGGAPPYNLICNVPSGSIEPVGSYVIRCMGQDREDDSTPYQTFDVTITPPTTPFVDAPPGYVPDVTGCANSSCMASSLTGADFDGASCDLASTTCTVTTASPVTLHAWNQTGDVKVAITANGQPVSIAATTFTEQQSGITYTSAPITPQPGTNVITATVDDPLGRLPAAVYTWTIEYTAPTSSSTGGAGNSSSGGSSSSSSSSTSSGGSSTSSGSGGPTSSSSPSSSQAPKSAAQLASAALSAPKIAKGAKGQTFSFALKLPVAATVQGTLATRAGRTVLRFSVREQKGRSVVKRSIARRALANGTLMTLRLTIRTGKASRSLSIRFRA